MQRRSKRGKNKQDQEKNNKYMAGIHVRRTTRFLSLFFFTITNDGSFLRKSVYDLYFNVNGRGRNVSFFFFADRHSKDKK